MFKVYLRKTSNELDLQVEVRRAALAAIIAVGVYLVYPQQAAAAADHFARSLSECLKRTESGSVVLCLETARQVGTPIPAGQASGVSGARP